MKLLLLRGAIVLFALGIVGSAVVKADELADIRARGKLMCGLTIVQPFAYYDPQTRELVGYEVDLCRMLAEDLKVGMEYKVVAADVRVPELVQGRIDLLVALMSYTKERAQIIDFSNAYVEDGFYFIKLKSSDLKSVEELADKRISAAKGSLYATAAAKKFPQATVVTFDDGPLAFLALQQGKVDATIQRSAAAVGLQLRSPPGSPEIELMEPPLLKQGSGFGVRKGETAFMNYLNDFLDRLETSGKAQALWDKWLGKDSPYKLERPFKVGSKMG